MVWSKRNTYVWDIHKTAKNVHFSKQAKTHARLQLWLWRKRQKKCFFGRLKCKQHELFCSPSHHNVNGKIDESKFKACGKACDEAISKSSIDVSSGADENKLEVCKINGDDYQSVSADAEFSFVHENLNGSHDVKSGANGDCDETGQKLTTDVVLVTENNEGDISLEIKCHHQQISKIVQEYLCHFQQKYGSFFPLERSGIIEHLKEKFNKDIKDCEVMILEIIIEAMAKIVNFPYFEVKYKKHKLTLDDLSTLANENWLNDQVINLYGELIMESSNSKVHFLNSFFHKQLITKGYEGVKRWTKQVDLFSKSLLLVPVHLEVHWCLVTADFINRTVCLYDSQGIGLQDVARNVVKYLLKEEKEKKPSAFEMGWTVSLKEEIPQQTNENDCGIFVLEYSRCLALAEPLQFSQRDIPKIRKRIYKELCDCTLHKNC